MASIQSRPIAVALAIEDDSLRCSLGVQLEAAGCDVVACERRARLDELLRERGADLSLVIADAAWLSESKVATSGPPALAVQREESASERPPRATACVRVAADGSGEGRLLWIARHLIEQDHRWEGAWISTGLLRRDS